MYLVCTCSLLVVYICWTITMQQSIKAIGEGRQNHAAGTATIAFIFRESSAFPPLSPEHTQLTTTPSLCPLLQPRLQRLDLHVPGGAVAIRRALPRHRHLPVLRPRRRLLHHLRQPHRPEEHLVEVADHVLLLARVRDCVCVVLLPRDCGSHA
jgi:hypothetical protein